MNPTYSGIIVIKDNKIESLDLKVSSTAEQSLEIEKIIALKNIVDEYMIQYEKEYKRD